MSSNATYRTWAVTVRPLTREDVTYLVEKLNKHPGIEGWWGHEEMVDGDESSRHIHLALKYPKGVLKYTVSKWLKKTLAHTETWASEKLQWKAGVCVKVWYNNVWIEAYMDGEQLNSKYELDEETMKRIEKAYPDKDDARAVKPTREKKPQVPDRVVSRWNELYNNKPQSTFQIRDFIRWMMYTEKSIGFLNKHKMEEVQEHVWLMLTEKNDLPKPWGIPDKLKRELLLKVESRKVAYNQGHATTMTKLTPKCWRFGTKKRGLVDTARGPSPRTPSACGERIG